MWCQEGRRRSGNPDDQLASQLAEKRLTLISEANKLTNSGRTCPGTPGMLFASASRGSSWSSWPKITAARLDNAENIWLKQDKIVEQHTALYESKWLAFDLLVGRLV